MSKRIAIMLTSILYLVARSLFVRVVRAPRSWSLNVLCYHGVPARLRAAFAWQLDYLSRHLTLAHPDHMQTDGQAVLVTFDDALLSLRDNALPQMSQRGIPCLIFVPTGYLGNRCTWMRSPEAWRAAEGCEIAPRDREQLETDRVMTAEELTSLNPSLCVLGSHTVRHRKLGQLSASELTDELQSSSQTLRDITGKPPLTISFPHGEHNEAVLEALAKAGYETAFSISPSIARKPQLLCGRVVVDPSDWKLEFMLKARGGYEWIPFVIRMKRRLMRGFAAASHGQAQG